MNRPLTRIPLLALAQFACLLLAACTPSPGPAAPAADRCSSLAPDYAECHRVRGQALEGLNRIAEAREAYQEALSLAEDPEERRKIQDHLDKLPRGGSARVPDPEPPRLASVPEPAVPSAPTTPAVAAPFTGSWRPYPVGPGSSTRRLELRDDGIWAFGSSGGTWSVGPIAQDDWSRWDLQPYGPTRKLTLAGWNNDVADGPVEESGGRVDFFWVIYRVGPPTVSAPAVVHAKYGH